MTATAGTTIKDFGVYNSAFANITAPAGGGYIPVPFGPILLAGLTNADVITAYTPGFNGKIIKVAAINIVAATTADKAASLTFKIGSTATTGGVLALTSANMTPKGAVVAGSSITAANTFTSTDTISLVASSVTAFVEGSAIIVVTLQNTDNLVINSLIYAKVEALTTFFKSFGQILDTLPEGVDA